MDTGSQRAIPRMRFLPPAGVVASGFDLPCSLPIHQNGDVSVMGDTEANTQVIAELRQKGERERILETWVPSSH